MSARIPEEFISEDELKKNSLVVDHYMKYGKIMYYATSEDFNAIKKINKLDYELCKLYSEHRITLARRNFINSMIDPFRYRHSYSAPSKKEKKEAKEKIINELIEKYRVLRSKCSINFCKLNFADLFYKLQ